MMMRPLALLVLVAGMAAPQQPVFRSGADLVRSMALRAGAEITEVESSHVVMMSQPQAVTDVIVKAAEAVRDASG